MSKMTHDNVVVYLFRTGKTNIPFCVEPFLMETEEEMGRVINLIDTQCSADVDITLGEHVILAAIILDGKPYVVLMWTYEVDPDLMGMIRIMIKDYKGTRCSDEESRILLSKDIMCQLRELIFSIRQYGVND